MELFYALLIIGILLGVIVFLVISKSNLKNRLWISRESEKKISHDSSIHIESLERTIQRYELNDLQKFIVASPFQIQAEEQLIVAPTGSTATVIDLFIREVWGHPAVKTLNLGQLPFRHNSMPRKPRERSAKLQIIPQDGWRVKIGRKVYSEELPMVAKIEDADATATD